MPESNPDPILVAMADEVEFHLRKDGGAYRWYTKDGVKTRIVRATVAAARRAFMFNGLAEARRHNQIPPKE